MAESLGFRLVVRNAADTADELIVSSVPGGDNPYLLEPPTVDGASADLLEGTCDVGSGTITFWDEYTDVTVPADVFADPFDYADVPALDAVWPEGGGLPDGTATWSIATDRYVSATQSLKLALAGYGGAAGTLYREVVVGGLVANALYTVTVRVRQSATGDSISPGLWTAGGSGFQTTAATTAGAWETLTLTQQASPSGDLTIRLVLGSDFANTTTRDVWFDEVRVRGGSVATTGRVMTARLHDVVDGVARLAPLSRVARIEQTRDGGTDWTAYHRGFLNRVEIDGGAVTVTVGDTTRREQQTELWATLPTLDPADVGLPMPAPRVGLILGGPIAADATYGKFAAIEDYGPTRWFVEESLLDAAEDDRLVALKFSSGYLRPWYAKVRTSFEQDEWEKVNNAGRGYFVWDPERYQSGPGSTVNSFGYFPDLVARLVPVGGGDTLEKVPIARPVKHEPLDKTKPKAEFSALTGNDSILYVDWGPDAFPANGTQYDVTLYSPVISADNPLLLAGHPIDLVAYAAELSGVPWDDASRETAKAAIGDGHWCELAIEGVEKFADFQKKLGGAYGFLLRPNAETGLREFVPTRVRPAAPVFAITNADRIDAGDGQPVVFAAEEDSVVNVVSFAQKRFRRFRYKEDEGDPPITMMATADATVEGARGDTTVNGERTIRYELPGQMQVRATDGSVAPLVLATFDDANPGYAEQAGGVIIDFAGWGIPETVVLIDADSPAAAAQLGDEGTLEIPDLPVPNASLVPVTARDADRTAPPRVVRVVKIDPQPGAFQMTLVHAGELSQDAVDAPETGGSTDTGEPTLPTYTLTASVDAPTTVAVLTLTNGADLAADNLRTEPQYLVQTATPAAEDEGTDFGPVTTYPDGDATTIDLPAVTPGSTVWARARSVDPYSGRASAWGAWISVVLDTVTNGETPDPGTGYVAPPELTWTIDETTGAVTVTAIHATAAEVRVAGGASVPDDATTRAAPGDTAAPFTFADLFTLALGATGYAAGYAYDAAGNESAKRVVTIRRGTGAPDGGGYALPYSRPLLANASGRRSILPAFGATPAEYDAGLRFAYDCTRVRGIQLQGWVGRLDGEATHLGATDARLVLAARPLGTTDWRAVDGSGVGTAALATAGPALPLDAAGLQFSDGVDLPASLQTLLEFTAFTRDGDGAARPWCGNVAIDFYGEAVPEAPPPDEGGEECPVHFEDSFTGYANVAAVDAVWAPGGGLASGTAEWSLSSESVDSDGASLQLATVGYGGAPGNLYRQYVVGGLTPSTTYRVTVRVWQDVSDGGITPQLWTAGGTGFQTTSTTAIGTWATLTLNQEPSPDGSLTIRLVLTSDHGGTTTRLVRFDDVRVSDICE